ncbi:serine-type D-Ala-D-Ala carboxypeptidase [Providencia alcalifaciens]|uniref:D-alanyl-D-alanine carboxypeptidase/D-alanyl-D-alanine-endopeptidase n=1 Tax=Providencia alcalifaciens DSM 30120 TaxID=520999 RepID=B6XCI5_9GAMM|nr:serine-type D-Ala-D-Ala carboxypeptidase [Providencia alcalifaciens]ATG15908.1 serine-type D-Ala-D-Ala carboxypeptidase [Providencia alcalifaciens]EEB46935.1 D-alanyl-D-alanine carboxypeptidase/D-alanyl-D-alanine-endopeptidase [Providencia alcalifaciens DSM 30120]MTC25610.1 serine-type D-Ala-D-Ala carboxypeptidase [Providencia alcalifaciens]SPY74273.1 D-alanyl-D-alanine carboxypeptidase dacB precursor [Providencia alcalifaciens]SQI42181.1 D-alanyl-D-alanine carboxypeptidase dacB precursor [
MSLLTSTRKLIFTLGLAFITSQASAIPIDDYKQYLPDGTNLALVAQKVGSNTPLIDYNAQQMALPASTQKVVTALAALLQLGPDYRFVTNFETNGKLNNNTLSGDLVIRFSGDPTLTRQQIRNMVNALKQIGIHKVDGDLIVDISAFASHDKAPGWVWNDMTQCFSAPPAAAIIDRNCFSVSLYPSDKAGEMAYIKTASFYPVNMFSEVKTLAKGSPEARYCELDVVPGELNRYTLTGCLTQRSDPLPLAFAVQNGASYSGAIVKNELQVAGIELSGAVKKRTQPTPQSQVLVKTESKPLHDLLKIMLKKSDNMIADTVFRTIGRDYYGVPGTWRSGSDAVRQVLKQKAGIDLGNTVMVDGSGLSRHNLITPATMMQVLQFIAKNDQQLDYISMLPLAGHDGTLRYRGGLDEAGVNGKVSAKTGALQGVYNLAGFITTASGEKVAFVQFISAYAVPQSQYNSRRVPLVRFESRLYRDLYQKN